MILLGGGWLSRRRKHYVDGVTACRMDEDTLNLEIRSFLKEFGVTAQRELEMAIHDAVESGELAGDETLDATATLAVEVLGLEHEIADTIALE